jgi:hypothetical protein
MRLLVVMMFAVVGLGGCDGVPFLRGCTLIGCGDGLTVVLANAPAGEFAVEVRVPGAAARRQECASAAACSTMRFDGVVAAEATVAIITPTGEVTRTVRPEYVVSRPNGPDCEPTCRQARVTVSAS